MRVLSLFDGISCGHVALDRAGIPVEAYDAFEIDKFAIQVTQKNYPNTTQHGDVFDADFTQFEGYDLLIGGSPCTYWSCAKQGREITPDGQGGKLFMEYVRALEESKCKWFLYENNYSIHKDIKAFISDKLGVEPVMINSANFSAQSRKRCYWTNIPIAEYHDKGIVVKDILEENVDLSVYGCSERGRLNPNGTRTQHLEIRKDGKTNCITTVQKDCMICRPIRIGEFGKGRQGQRIYSIEGKSPTIMASQGDRSAGLYKIDLPDGDYIVRKITPIEAERLQTLPDNYTEGVSKTQRYRQIGNGWTVDVIAHILRGLKNFNK